ncbi:hypothetical protein L7F22_041037 [Adiantum nelumboides]|nr:hypothetical protein [Adiantum nelumboides]
MESEPIWPKEIEMRTKPHMSNTYTGGRALAHSKLNESVKAITHKADTNIKRIMHREEGMQALHLPRNLMLVSPSGWGTPAGKGGRGRKRFRGLLRGFEAALDAGGVPTRDEVEGDDAEARVVSREEARVGEKARNDRQGHQPQLYQRWIRRHRRPFQALSLLVYMSSP